jgi:hypothetical protein
MHCGAVGISCKVVLSAFSIYHKLVSNTQEEEALCRKRGAICKTRYICESHARASAFLSLSLSVCTGGRAGALVRSIEAFPVQMRQTSLIKWNERVHVCWFAHRKCKKLNPSRCIFLPYSWSKWIRRHNSNRERVWIRAAESVVDDVRIQLRVLWMRLRVIFHYLLFDSARHTVIYRPGGRCATMYR